MRFDAVYDSSGSMLSFNSEVKTQRGRIGKLKGAHREIDTIYVEWNDEAALHYAQPIYPEAVSARWDTR